MLKCCTGTQHYNSSEKMASRPSPLEAAAVVPEPTVASTVPLNGKQSLFARLFRWLPSWKPTSESLLEEAETLLLKDIKSEYRDSCVPIASNAVVRTISMEPEQSPEPERLPLVMVHGFGAGFLQFHKNLDYLHSRRRLLALDLPGFGRSTRVPFTPDAQSAEEEFVDSIERWRQAAGVERFILLGHSLGAFLACAYTMKYPSRVRHLILVDPWGFAIPPCEAELKQRFRSQFSLRARMLWNVVNKFNPFATIRAAGPWGPDIMDRVRPDLRRTFGDKFMNYTYHCNAQKPSGEAAFFHMQYNFGWAKRPMLARIDTQLTGSTPITLIYGVRSWMDINSGEEVRACRPNSYVDVHYVRDAGHHLHAQQPETFNRIVNGVCSLVDSGRDLERDRVPGSAADHEEDDGLEATRIPPSPEEDCTPQWSHYRDKS